MFLSPEWNSAQARCTSETEGDIDVQIRIGSRLISGLALTVALALPAPAATFIIMTSDNPKKPVLLDADSSRGSIKQTGTQSAEITINGPAGTSPKTDKTTITDSFEVAASNGISLSAQGGTTLPFSGPAVIFIDIQSYDYEGDPLTCAEGEISECTLKEAYEGALVKLGTVTWSDGTVDTVYLQPPLKRKKAPSPPAEPAWFGSIVRLSLMFAGPVTPPPGTPVEAVVGLTDLNGNTVGQPVTIPLVAGQIASVDFNANLLASAAGQHVNVVPTISASPNGWLPAVQLTTEIFDSATGIGMVLDNSTGFQDGPSALGPQGLAVGETMRIVATAVAPNSCVATLSFADTKDNRIGSSLVINLPPGQSKLLDLTADSLSIVPGQRVQVRPVLTLPTQAGAPDTTTCAIASEVFDQATGRTRTYQTGLY
jgi:hypothetical protein